MAEDLDQIVDNLKQPASWIRVLFMIGFAILLYVIITPVVFLLMIVQALFVLLTGELNTNLKYFGAVMTQYVSQILLYISYNSETRPFPFSEFPVSDEDQYAGSEESEHAAPEAVAPAETTKPAQRKPTSKSKTTGRAAKTADSDIANDAEPG